MKYDILAGEKAARLFANAEAALFQPSAEVAKERNENELITKLHRMGSVLGKWSL
jgi:hypothetical protein